MKSIVLTTSWDDGHRCDLRLAQMLTQHGLKGTFYISPRNREFAASHLLTERQIRDIGRDFEIGSHTLTHPALPTISGEKARREIIDSKTVLEQVTGDPVNSFCYPKGAYTESHIQLVREAGYKYARTVRRYKFTLNDPYQAGTSLHIYNHGLGFDLLRTARFVNFRPVRTCRCLQWGPLGRAMFDFVLAEGGIFHVWGHSWEIDRNNDWELLDSFFRYISGHPRVSYATNGELEAGVRV